jgi:hypothetical protein
MQSFPELLIENLEWFRKKCVNLKEERQGILPLSFLLILLRKYIAYMNIKINNLGFVYITKVKQINFFIVQVN